MFAKQLTRFRQAEEPATHSGVTLKSFLILLLLLMAAAILPTTASASSNITTMQNIMPFSATMITGIAFDPYDGSLFYADYVQGRIVQVFPKTNGSGYTITVLDNTITQPIALTNDDGGNLYIADASGHVYKKTRNNAGTYDAKVLIASGFQNPSGLAADSSGNFFVSDSVGNSVTYFANGVSGYASGVAAGTGWNTPTALAYDHYQRLYVSDANGIHYMYEPGPFASSMYTNGFTSVQSMTFDYSGNLFIGDSSGNVIEIFPITDTLQTAFVGTNMGFVGAMGFWGYFDTPIVGSSMNGSFSRLMNNFGSQATGTYAPAVDEVSAMITFNTPTTLGVPIMEVQGNFFDISSEFTVDPAQSTCQVGHAYTPGQFCFFALKFYPAASGIRAGSLIPVDTLGNQIAPAAEFSGVGRSGEVAFTPGIEYLTNEMPYDVYGYGTVTSLSINSQNDVLISTSEGNSGYILIGQPYGNFKNPLISLWSSPIEAAALDGNGDILFSDNTGTITEAPVKANPGSSTSYGNFTTLFTQDALGNAFTFINSLAVDTSNNIYFADASPDGTKGTKKIYKAYYAGNGTWAAPVAIGGPYTRPFSVVLDSSGDVYFIDRVNDTTSAGTIYELFTEFGQYSPIVVMGATHPSNGLPNLSTSLYVDPNGNIYVADAVYQQHISSIYELTWNYSTSPYTIQEQTYWTPVYSNPLTGHIPFFVSMDTYGDMFFNSGVDYSGVDLLELDAHDAPVLFFTAPENQASEPQTLNVTNYGLDWLHFTVPASGTNPSFENYSQYYSFDNSAPTACQFSTPSVEASVQYGTTCTLTIGFDYQSSTKLTSPLTLNNSLDMTETNPTSAQYPTLVATVTPEVSPAATVTLTSSQNPATYLSTVTFVSTVIGNGGTTPTGTVTFKDGATTLGIVNLTGSAVSLNISSLTVGSHAITANYSGDTFYAAAQSFVLNQQITAFAAPTVSLSSTLNPATVNNTVTFVSSVVGTGGTTPTGTVTFKDGTTTLGAIALNSAGTASFSTSTLTIGSHPITAAYGGDSNYPTSTSSVLNEVILAAGNSSVTLSASASPVFTQNPVTFVAGVVNSGAGTPTGTISFYDGPALIGTGALDNTGNTSITLSSLAIGTHSITAAYGGDTSYPQATSSPLAEVVEDFNLSITSTANPIVAAGQSVTIPFTLSMISPGTTMPAAITLSAEGAPYGSSYTFSPLTVASGSGATNGTLTINIPVDYVATNSTPMKPGSKLPLAPLALALLVLPLTGRMRKTGKGLVRMMALALFAIAGITASSTLTGCGSNTAAPYAVTVTASSGNLSHTSTFLITVKSR
jgi:sugar lactone lactonase YvrE